MLATFFGKTFQILNIPRGTMEHLWETIWKSSQITLHKDDEEHLWENLILLKSS